MHITIGVKSPVNISSCSGIGVLHADEINITANARICLIYRFIILNIWSYSYYNLQQGVKFIIRQCLYSSIQLDVIIGIKYARIIEAISIAVITP